jgi:hypothetical protein
MIHFLFLTLHDTSPPILDDFDLADDILGLVYVLPSDVAPKYLLDLYGCPNHLRLRDRHA